MRNGVGNPGSNLGQGCLCFTFALTETIEGQIRKQWP